MKRASLARVPDRELLMSFETLVRQDRSSTAELVAHIAEVDARRLWAPAGCASMYAYCVRVWHMSEDVAYKRIRAARAARRFPVLLDALADGRLHLAGVVLLDPCLTSTNVDELLALATHRRKAEIEAMLAERFPREDVPTKLEPVPTHGSGVIPTEAPAILEVTSTVDTTAAEVAPVPSLGTPECMGQLAPGPVVPSNATESRDRQEPLEESSAVPAASPAAPVAPTRAVPYTRVAPLSPGRYALQVTIDQETHALLQRAKALLAHAQPASDTADVLKRALAGLVAQLEKARFAATDSPRPRTSHANGRYIPAEIRREVWARDGGRCTFVGDNGCRCEDISGLEFDHVLAVARGGQTTAANLRLLCRAHNRLEAERTFGVGFMGRKLGAAARTAQPGACASG